MVFDTQHAHEQIVDILQSEVVLTPSTDGCFVLEAVVIEVAL